MNLRKWIQKKRPYLTADHARARLDWAQAYKLYTLEDWKRVIWSDECTIERGVGIKPVWTFVRPRDQCKEKDVRTVRPSGKGVKKMLWAAFAHNRRTSLIPLNGDPLAARDKVTSWVIQELYRAFLSDIMNDDDVFIYNSAGLYRGQIVKDILREMNIRVIG